MEMKDHSFEIWIELYSAYSYTQVVRSRTCTGARMTFKWFVVLMFVFVQFGRTFLRRSLELAGWLYKTAQSYL